MTASPFVRWLMSEPGHRTFLRPTYFREPTPPGEGTTAEYRWVAPRDAVGKLFWELTHGQPPIPDGLETLAELRAFCDEHYPSLARAVNSIWSRWSRASNTDGPARSQFNEMFVA